MRSLVYVSGPITEHPAGPWEGVRDALIAGDKLFDYGYAPFVPHLTHYWAEEHNQDRTYEDWIALDLAVVPRVDAMLRLPGKSSGSDREVACAIANGIPVFRELGELRLAVSPERTECATAVMPTPVIIEAAAPLATVEEYVPESIQQAVDTIRKMAKRVIALVLSIEEQA